MSRLRSFYDERILPRMIEVTCSARTTGRWREQVCGPLAGDVLEVGFGSGTNLGFYPDAVEQVLAVEPADLAWQRAQGAVAAFGRPVSRVGLDGAALALPDESVDAVVSSYTMCTIPALSTALGELRRVLRPGGAVHFVEHALAPDDEVAARQRRWQPRWEKISGGCHLDRDIPGVVAEAGFTLDGLETFYAPGPGFMRPFNYLTIGRALR